MQIEMQMLLKDLKWSRSMADKYKRKYNETGNLDVLRISYFYRGRVAELTEAAKMFGIDIDKESC